MAKKVGGPKTAVGGGKTTLEVKQYTKPDGGLGLTLDSITMQGGGGGSQGVFLYGPPKTGKTTMCADIPDAVFLLTESGLGQNKAKAFPVLQSLDQTHQALDICLENEFPAVVIDTVDHLERFVFEAVCKNNGKASIEDFGYGKGYKYAAEAFESVLQKLDRLVSEGTNVILVGHSIVKSVNDPSTPDPYDQFIPDLNKNIWGLLKDWVDAILFVHRRVFVNEDTGKGADGGLVIETSGSAAWEAGNRWRVNDRIKVEQGCLARLLDSVVSDRQKDISI